jgi:hypothetical protein
MAKRRKARSARKASRARPARRRTTRRKSDADETMNIIAALLVVVLIGLGIYFYQLNQKPGATGMSNKPPATVTTAAPKPAAPGAPAAPATK